MRKTVCRICLRSDFQRADDIDVKLLHFYDELCDFEILQNNNLKFCTTCEDILRKFYNFRLRCHQAHVILKTHEKKGIENLQNLLPSSCIELGSQSENIIDLPQYDKDQPENNELESEELIEMDIKMEDVDDPISVAEDRKLNLECDIVKQEDVSKPDDFAMSCTQTDSTNTKQNDSINNEIMMENDETIIKEEEIIDDQYDDIDNFDSDDEEIPKINKKQDPKKTLKQKKIIRSKAMKRKLDEKGEVDDISSVGHLNTDNTTRKQKPLTSAERQKLYRERLKEKNPEKFIAQKKKNAERNKRKRKKIFEYDSSEQDNIRKRWRERRRKANKINYCRNCVQKDVKS